LAYNIVFIDQEASADTLGNDRNVGENVFLSDVPKDSKVFLFFYPGGLDTDDVERGLRDLGNRTGDNLFVNFGSLADPDYRSSVERFGIKLLPVIVMTAIAPLAETPTGETTFFRLDSVSLFERPADLLRTVEKLFNLFLDGKVTEAARSGQIAQGQAAAASLAGRIWRIIQPVITWLSRLEITIEAATGKIEVKAGGDS